MSAKWIKVPIVSLLAAALWAAGCSDQATSADRLLGPDAVSYSKEKVDGDKKLKIKPVKGKLPSGEKIEKKDIDEKGGELKVAGHVLSVPAGAVTRKTRFTMRVFTSTVDNGGPGGGDRQVNVGVKLRASRWDCDGDGSGEKHSAKKGCDEVDIGANGFAVPVELRLTYDWATNVGVEDEVMIYWLKDNRTAVPFATTVDKKKKFATASLDHFSDYLLAMP